MEQCPSLRNEDMISELPDALLLQILSLLPTTKDAVATCVLSKRWRFLCKMTPNLRFRYGRTNDLKRFSNNVCRCLLSHQAPVLQSLHLEMDFENDSTIDIGVLLGIAFGRQVRELELQVYSGEPYKFPSSLYNSETLETLKLYYDVLVDVPFPVSLKALRTLSLFDVNYKDEGSIINLLSGCSILENLEVLRYSQCDVKTFTIDVPSLQSLTLTFENQNESDIFTAYLINAPSLKHLEINDLMEYNSSCLIENMPQLVDAHIHVSGVIYENIHGSLASAKRLCLKISSPVDLTKFPTDRIFNQLVHLELHAYEPDWWNLFILILDNSPNLQVLKLNSYWLSDGDRVVYERWTQPKFVPECLLNCLETLVWENHEGEIEDEKKVAHYILRNASRLKTATFSRTDIHPDKNLEWLKELESVVRASNSCHLVFKQN